MNRKDVESILGKGTVQDIGVVKRIEGPASRVDLIVTRSDTVSSKGSPPLYPKKLLATSESLSDVERTLAQA